MTHVQSSIHTWWMGERQQERRKRKEEKKKKGRKEERREWGEGDRDRHMGGGTGKEIKIKGKKNSEDLGKEMALFQKYVISF